MTRIIIADDQRLLRESLKHTIEHNSDIEVVACATNGIEAIKLCDEHLPDLVLMDISMPDLDGVEATKQIRAKHKSIKILILTVSTDTDDIIKAITNGANGYILKDVTPEELILAIRSVSAGLDIIHKDLYKKVVSIPIDSNKETIKSTKNYVKVNNEDVALTDREIKILGFIVEGKTNKEIASSLFVAEGRVKNIITEIIAKLNLKDRTQLAVFALKNNLL